MSYRPENEWRGSVKRHWRVFALFAVAAAVIFAGGVYAFLWFAANAQSTGLVPAVLGLWTMGNLVGFMVYLALWELLVVGAPAALVVGLAWWWWRRIPEEERRGSGLFGRRWSKRSRGGGGASFLFFVAFVIKVYVDGKWDVPIGTLTLDYVVGSAFTILVWGVVIVGIPGTLAALWWIRRWTKTG